MKIADLSNDPKALKELISSLGVQLSKQDQQISKLDQQVSDSHSVIEELTEQVRLLKALYFAQKSEQLRKPERNEQQYSLFDEAEFVAEQEDSEDLKGAEGITVKSYSRKKGRKAIPETFPREAIIHDIPEEEKICKCGCRLTKIGEVVSEKLDIVPQKITVKRHIRPKYACRSCEGTEDEGPTVKIAPMVSQLIKQGIVTPGLIAYILVNKFCDGLPFYRQNKMFDRLGIDISRSTMSSWAIQAAQKSEPLLELFYKKLRAGNIINIDETPTQVLGEDGRKNTTKSYMWVAKGGAEEEIVGDFHGFLQSDGYAGYNELEKSDAITRVGCLVHVRRKFYDVIKASSKKKKGTAVSVLNLIGKVYHIEGQAKKQNLLPDKILALREEKIKPIFNKIADILKKSAGNVPPKSLLGKAITYGLNQWSRVEAYLKNPYLTPDNNVAENAIRPFAIGRKNWLFSGSPRGAKSSATIYSLVETAKANNLNPYEYLIYIFEKLPFIDSAHDLEALLPWEMPKDKAI